MSVDFDSRIRERAEYSPMPVAGVLFPAGRFDEGYF
jgi:hypothetical protein